MWTDESRLRHDRSGLRYTHDLTDAAWALVEPLIPPAKCGSNKRIVNIREVVNGPMYIPGTGCIDPPSYDAGKKIKGKKRQIMVDTTGLLMHAIVHPADIQDRDGGPLVVATQFGLFPFLLKLYADGGYQGPVCQAAVKTAMAQLNVEIVKRSDQAKDFIVVPRRWVVERMLAWLDRCRRLAKDWECLNRKARAFLILASIRFMVRRPGRAIQGSRTDAKIG